MSPSPPADLDSDVMSVASFGGSDSNSYYVKLAENSPTSPAKTRYLAGNVSELEAMQKILEGDIKAIARPTVLFSQTNELKIPELDDTDTNPSENLEDNGATPPVNTQKSPPRSPQEDTLVASAEPL